MAGQRFQNFVLEMVNGFLLGEIDGKEVECMSFIFQHNKLYLYDRFFYSPSNKLLGLRKMKFECVEQDL